MNIYPWALTQPAGQFKDGGFTRSESALWARIKLAGQQVGIAQNIRWEGQSGNSPIKGIGEPSSENKPGDLFWTGSVSRFSIRGMRLLDIVMQTYPGLANGNLQVDFRQLPFELEIDYQQYGFTGGGSTPPSPGTTPPSQYEDTKESLEGVWIQTWSGEFSDPNALRMENLTFWAMGYTYGVGNGGIIATMGNSPAPVPWVKMAA